MMILLRRASLVRTVNGNDLLVDLQVAGIDVGNLGDVYDVRAMHTHNRLVGDFLLKPFSKWHMYYGMHPYRPSVS